MMTGSLPTFSSLGGFEMTISRWMTKYKAILLKSRTARSFGGLRMTGKVGSCHPKVVAGADLPCTNKGLCHVNHPVIVILRPPKDLAVLPFEGQFGNIG
jgi:hypothetical protein